jgi:hypothetical protein
LKQIIILKEIYLTDSSLAAVRHYTIPQSVIVSLSPLPSHQRRPPPWALKQIILPKKVYHTTQRLTPISLSPRL